MEELLELKVAAPVQKTEINGRGNLFFVEKIVNTKNGPGSAHPAFCSTFL
jgi:hypothetical protein